MAELINSITLLNTTYQNRSDILDVDLVYTPWQNNDMSSAFVNCTNLTDVFNINQNVTNMANAFNGCSNLVNAPVMPDGITDINNTFQNCTSLRNVTTLPNSVTNVAATFAYCSSLVNAPVIHNGITDMDSTFWECTRLANIAEIPNSVISLNYTFYGCYNLVNAPEIPNSVTFMSSTFSNCVNLTGDIYIQSENITNAINCFKNTTLNKDVYIPVQNNGVNTATYNAFKEAGYSRSTRVNGVLLKDLNYDPLIDYEYTKNETNDVLLTKYIGYELHVVVPTVE